MNIVVETRQDESPSGDSSKLPEDTAKLEFMTVRYGLRNALGEKGIATNPGSNDSELLVLLQQSLKTPTKVEYSDQPADWNTLRRRFFTGIGTITGEQTEGKTPEQIVMAVRQSLEIE